MGAPIFEVEPIRLISHYDAFMLDIWGTVHDGKELFPSAIQFMKEARAAGKLVMFLSNSPRTPANAVARLLEMGMPEELFHDVLTSGRECVQMLTQASGDFHATLGKTLYYYGPAGETSAVDELIAAGYALAEDLEAASFVLITDMRDDYDTLDTVIPFLEACLKLGLPIVSANGDNYAMFGADRLVCAGAVARAYERMGGKAYCHGKPTANIYALAHSMLLNASGSADAGGAPLTKEQILMIGDNLATDIAGAAAYGMHSLLVLTGIHEAEMSSVQHDSPEGAERLAELGRQYGAVPTYWARAL